PDASLVDRNYFVYAAQNILEEMKSRVHGSTMRHIVKDDFQSLRIPIPPLPIQKHIAGLLDRGRRLQLIRERANRLTDKIIRSVFLKMFGNPSDVGTNVPRARLSDLVQNLDRNRVPLNAEARSKR